MTDDTILDITCTALEDIKARDIRIIDVSKLTAITDHMVIASGTSDRHVKSVADRVVEAAKKAGYRPSGVEGYEGGEWILVDLQDVVVHVMQPRVRDFYQLEKLWNTDLPAAAADGDSED